MGGTLQLQVDGSAVNFEVLRVMVAGYTGRDSKQVRAHIEELERHGIPAPDSVPSLYPIDASFATTEEEIVIASRAVSGEAEPALLFPGNDLESALVSVISDFTDREEERRSIARSKLFPKPLSARVWKYSNMAGVWDEIKIRSWVDSGPERKLYQSGNLSQLLPPRELLAQLGARLGKDLRGTVLLMGTVPLCDKEFSFSDTFSCEIETPQHSKLAFECRIRRSDPK